MLALLIPLATVTTPLLLSAATAVLIAVSIWESISLRHARHGRKP